MKKKHKIIVGIAGGLFLVASLVMAETYLFSVISRGIKPNEEDLNNHSAYSRLCIFGIDGAGGYMEDDRYVVFHNIFDKGSTNYNVMTQHLCDSAPNWFSIFHGVSYLKHNISNGTADKAKDCFDKYPSFIKTYLDNNPNNNAYSIVNWGVINDDLLENHPRLTKVKGVGTDAVSTDIDVKNKVINVISNEDVGIMYMHFDEADSFGHGYRNKSEEYKIGMDNVSSYIKEIYDTYVNLGYGDDTLFMAVTDHGMDSNGNHGAPWLSIRKSMIAIYGNKQDIKVGHPSFTVNQDFASIALYALNIKQPSSYTSSVPKNMFKTL